ncbi:hypothetical protein JCM33374_g2462 [Metschnikowia sp. JCM 33374]|nr:hypothetical protein JCM33374_g2462 [Metschnikowia sp. JCM 33374]
MVQHPLCVKMHAHAASTNNSQSPPASDRFSLVSEQLATRLSQFQKQNPNKCPNCFDDHKLNQCDQIQKDKPRENTAAHLIPDFNKQMNCGLSNDELRQKNQQVTEERA